jgi:quercetin dioxygenase-like cupin family protein
MLTRILAGLFLLAAPASTSLSELRLTPAELHGSGSSTSQIGSSNVAGVETKVLFGEPSRAGFYAIILSVPAHVTIQAHSHRDDRIAAVVSGTWRFGYGSHFSEASLKALPPGSVYSEPAGVNHFAQTADEPVQVEISGYGPTDTHYFDAANDPKTHGSR